MKHFTYTQPDSQRLDKFLVSKLPNLSRSSIEKLIEDGRVTVNNVTEKPSYKVRIGEKVAVDYGESDQTIPDIELPVLYEDDDCIVINKPPGVLTHSKGAFNPEATVGSFIAPLWTGQADDRGGIVHRLDRATSGVIVCAKTPEALGWLQKQFSQRRTKKTYYAVIEGVMNPVEAIIDMPIERNPSKPKQFRVGTGGKPAQTYYKTVQSNNRYSLLELKPVTGRTHQLRVHLMQQKHPIVGDELYEGEPYKRLLLHAGKLELTLPSRERKTFEASLPAEFNTIMESA